MDKINNIDEITHSVPKIKSAKKQNVLLIEEDEDEDKKEVKTIADVCENPELIDINFKKCVKGYHLINSSSINETIWERY